MRESQDLVHLQLEHKPSGLGLGLGLCAKLMTGGCAAELELVLHLLVLVTDPPVPARDEERVEILLCLS